MNTTVHHIWHLCNSDATLLWKENCSVLLNGLRKGSENTKNIWSNLQFIYNKRRITRTLKSNGFIQVLGRILTNFMSVFLSWKKSRIIIHIFKWIPWWIYKINNKIVQFIDIWHLTNILVINGSHQPAL